MSVLGHAQNMIKKRSQSPLAARNICPPPSSHNNIKNNEVQAPYVPSEDPYVTSPEDHNSGDARDGPAAYAVKRKLDLAEGREIDVAEPLKFGSGIFAGGPADMLNSPVKHHMQGFQMQ